MKLLKANCLDCSKSWPNPPTTKEVVEARKRAIASHLNTTEHTARVYYEQSVDIEKDNMQQLEDFS